MVVALITGQPAFAVDVERIEWGFGGRVIERRFVPLSLLIRNNSEEPTEGVLRLSKRIGGFRKVGVTLEEDFYLSGHASRWVQFSPYVLGDWEEWTVRWGDGADETIVLPRPQFDLPATVLLQNEDRIAPRSIPMKQIPSELFPSMSTITDGLHAVVLDHVPKWAAARRESLLDWVSRGGTLHVLKTEEGQTASFSKAWHPLERSVPTIRYGHGLIIRHDRRASEIDRDFVKSISYKPPPRPPDRLLRTAQDGFKESAAVDSAIFNQLRSMNRAGRSWPLIYLLSGLYLLILFPGFFGLARVVVDHRIVLAALLSAVVICSYGFVVISNRDYDELMQVRSVAVARPSDGAWQLLQWSDAYVTRGDTYQLKHEGQHTTYTAAQEFEAVLGTARNGTGGHLSVDIPPYSSQTFIVQRKVERPRLPMSLVRHEATGDRLTELTVVLGEDFPETRRQFALYGNRLYDLQRVGRRFSIKKDLGNASSYVLHHTNNRISFFFDDTYDERQMPDEAFTAITPLLIGRCLTDRTANGALPGGWLRIAVLLPMDDGTFVQTDWETDRLGHVLYYDDFLLQTN